MLLEECYCGEVNGAISQVNGIDIISCDGCGVARQMVGMSLKELAKFYQSYHYGTYTHTFEQDLDVAKKRIEAYGEILRGRVLDLGSGNGAFVKACQNIGLEAIGQDIGTKAPTTYNQPLEDCHFPCDYADVITMHDVVEHVPNPLLFLTEAIRILKDGGHLIVDLPDFYSSDGKHHWKKVEHLWYWRSEEFSRTLESLKMKYVKCETPVAGKFTMYFQKMAQPNPVRILVPPGIGDIYWVFVKLRSFIKVNHIKEPPVIYIDAPDDRKRSEDFVRSVPFVRFGGYWDKEIEQRESELASQFKRRKVLAHICENRKIAYNENGQHVFPGLESFDWFISYNGSMDAGESLAEADPEYEVDWDIPIFISKGDDIKRDWGYIVASFFDAGMYRKWIAELPPEKIYEMLAHIVDTTKKRVVLTGAEWDCKALVNVKLLSLDKGHGRLIDMIGQTTLGQYMGLLKNADGCIGFPAGNTILGPALGTKTGIIWNDHFDQRFHHNACKPGSDYIAYNSKDNYMQIAERFIAHVQS
jgi:SAM-dependent methyltransferase